MEYSKEDLIEAKSKILGYEENIGTEESKKIWEKNAQLFFKKKRKIFLRFSLLYYFKMCQSLFDSQNHFFSRMRSRTF